MISVWQRRGYGRSRRIAGVSLAALLALTMACRSRPSPNDDTDEPTKVQEASALHVTAPRWLAGEKYEYGLELASRLTMDERGMLIDLDLAASLVIEPHLLERDGEVQLLARLLDAQVRSTQPDPEEQLPALSRELARPFAFSLIEGKLSDVRVPEGSSRFAESIVKSVAAALQFARPDPKQQAAERTWNAAERDATGTYVAEYQLTERAGEFAKRKLRYEPISLGRLGFGQTGAQLEPVVLSSAGRIVIEAAPSPGLGKGSRLRGLEYSEELKTELTATSPIFARTTLKIAFRRQEPAGDGALDRQGVLAQTRVSNGEALRHSVPDRFDATRIGEYTFDTALRELEAQARNPESNKLYQSVRGASVDPQVVTARRAMLEDQGRAFGAMTALLRQDPRNVTRVVAKLRARSTARRTLFDALGSAGSSEAQGALVSLMQDGKLDVSVRREAAFSLGRTERPAPETVRAFQEYIEDPALRVHALYGLGTVARRIREAGEDERALAIARLLTDALGRAQTPAVQVHVLRAIANSGHPAAFNAVRPFLEAKSHKVQAAAVDALRLMSHPEVDGIIARQLERPDPAVQMAALDAVAVRTPSDVLAAALAAAGKDLPKPAARLKAVFLMTQWLPRRPGLRAALEHVAKHDAQTQVREAARAALGSGSRASQP